MLWPSYRRRVLAEADEYVESFGDQALDRCWHDLGKAQFNEDYKRSRLLISVVDELKKRHERDLLLDADERAKEPQDPYDHGAGFVVDRAKDTTLH